MTFSSLSLKKCDRFNIYLYDTTKGGTHLFNLYFAGTQAKLAEELIESKGLLRLLSYMNDKKHIQNRIDKGFVTFIDSGAFSAHTKGVQPDVDDYIQYLNDRDEFVSIAAQLDTIPGEFGKPKTKEQLLEAPEKSWENYLYMVERLKSPNKLLPIYHQGEDFKHLHRMLNHEPKIEYIGISPANDMPTSSKAIWIEECFKIIAASKNPNVKTHAFGMTALHLLERFPFTSADSTSWIMTGANGGIMSKFGVLKISKNGIKDKNHVLHMPEEFRKKLADYVGAHGFNLDELSEDYKERIKWNILYLEEWARNYQYKPRPLSHGKLFNFTGEDF